MALKKTDGVRKSTEEVIDEIENEEYRKDLGSVVVDEDGIVRDEELLCSEEYEGQLINTFSYREMNGKDEEAINKAEVRVNGGKLVNVLLERTVVALGSFTKKELGQRKWGELIRSLTGGNLDYMMTRVRGISKGATVNFTHKCPNCGTLITTEVDIDEFEITPFLGEKNIPFELPYKGYKDTKGIYHKTGTLRLANGFDREIIYPLMKKNNVSAETVLMTRLMSFDDGTPVIQNNVSEMSLRDRDYIVDLIKENVFGIKPVLDVECPNCGETLSGEVGQSDFF